MDEPHHDEINLIRLLRRLEKSVSNKEEWQPTQPEIWLKTQSALQVSILLNFNTLFFIERGCFSPIRS